jgi:hypothetical protein
MFQRKKIMETKKTKNKLKDKKLNKSISLIIKNNNFSNHTNQKKLYQFIPKTSYSVQTSERKVNKNTGNITTNNNNYLSQLYNLNFYRQNSQGSLYSLKKENNDFQFSDINYKYPRLNTYLLSEIKSPKIIEYINNRRKKLNNYNYSHNYNERLFENKCHNNNNNSNYYKKSSHNSFTLAKRNKNLSQRNMKIKLKLEEYYDNSFVKTKKNQKNNSRIKLKDDDSYMSKKTSGNRYDKNKCIIERKFYGEDKMNKTKNNNKTKAKNIEKDKEKYTPNKTLSGNGDNEYNKIYNNPSNYNLKKEIKKPGLDLINNYENNYSNHNLHQKAKKEKKNLSINNLLNYKWSSSKMLLNKSKTNNNILNTSLEEINKSKTNINNNSNYNNIIQENKESKNCRYNDIKLIFPSFFNKMDFNNESSQESTNLMGNTFSNKITINNSNMGSRKEKFINSFLDGPEDIHCRFVDLHRQRKLFYENMCNKANENEGNVNDNVAKISDFDKNEYSEYFDNINEDVTII